MQKPVNPTRRGLLVASSALALAGCATVPPATEKRIRVEGPLDTVDLLLNIGTFQAPEGGSQDPVKPRQRLALERLMPAIMARNGLQPQTFVVAGNDVYRNEFLRLVEQVRSPRYLLAIESVEYEISQDVPHVFFEAKLVDRTVRKTVWTARLIWPLDESQPDLRAEQISGNLLQLMAGDRWIKLPAGRPLDLEGRPIEYRSVFVKD